MTRHRHLLWNCVLCAVLLTVFPANPILADDLKTSLAPLTRGLDKFGSDVCRSLKLKCTKPAKPTSRNTGTSTPIAAAARQRAVPQAAQQEVAKTKIVAPVPKPKPLNNSTAVVKSPAVPPPIPKQKPAFAPKAETAPLKPTSKAPPVRTASLAPDKQIPAERRLDCLASLRNKGVEFEVLTAPEGDSRCSIDVPVRVRSVATPSGKVNLPEGPILSCQFADQFSRWLAEAGSAVVLAQLKTRLAKVSTGPGYECRGRNGDSNGKLSEHGLGAAVDITTLTAADGTTVHVADAINPASPSYQVLRAMRATACGYFTTVLGPGANAAHREHYHFDLAVHGKSGNYRICQ